MIRVVIIALALVVCVACGKYGPPVRSAGAPAAAPPAVSAAPAAADTEVCPDPNTPAPAAGKTP